MPFSWPRGFVALALAGAVSLSPVLAQTVGRDGVFKIGSRSLRCGRVPAVLDRDLPIEGAAVMGESVVLNPDLLKQHPETVRLFIYHHECGHHSVGGSELAADCYAVKQGARDGWLDQAGLAAVCNSLGDEPASSTHPSAKNRCDNMRKCFAKAAPPPAATVAVLPPAPKQAVRLLRAPKLVAEGVSPPAQCAAPDAAGAAAAKDPIGHMLEKLDAACDGEKAPQGQAFGARAMKREAGPGAAPSAAPRPTSQ